MYVLSQLRWGGSGSGRGRGSGSTAWDSHVRSFVFLAFYFVPIVRLISLESRCQTRGGIFAIKTHFSPSGKDPECGTVRVWASKMVPQNGARWLAYKINLIYVRRSVWMLLVRSCLLHLPCRVTCAVRYCVLRCFVSFSSARFSRCMLDVLAWQVTNFWQNNENKNKLLPWQM